MNVPGADELFFKGIEDFRENKENSVQGIVTTRADEIKFFLDRPNPRIPKILNESTFSILLDEESNLNGLGPFSFLSTSGNEITLLNRIGSRTSSKLVYKQSTAANAINLLKSKSGDMFLFSMSRTSINPEGINHLNAVNTFTPRTYFLAINAKLVSRSTRNKIFSRLNRKQIIDKCYPGNEITNSVIAPGFIGYDQKIEPISGRDFRVHNKTSQSIRINVGIMNGIENEDCMDRVLEYSSSRVKINSFISEASKITQDFSDGKLEAIFGYLEADNALEVFKYFSSNSKPSLGLPEDDKILRLINRFHNSKETWERQHYASKLTKHILNLGTFLPFFNPKSILLSSKDMEIKKSMEMLPPAYITHSHMKKRE